MKKFYKKTDLINLDQITEKTASQQPKPKKNRKLTLLFIPVLLIIIVIVGIGTYCYWYITSFAQASKIPPESILPQIKQGLQTSLKSDNQLTNILILGLEEEFQNGEASLLTNIIIILSYNHATHQLNLISLPRDVWIDEFKTKINALYYYGELSPDTSGKKFANFVIHQIFGQPLHYTLVVKMSVIEKVVNALGGIKITVPQTFTDEHFSRQILVSNGTIEPIDPFETLTFRQGSQLMDGHTSHKYLKTRVSNNPQESPDFSRSLRQLQVFQALSLEIRQRQTLADPHKIGTLYYLFRNEIDSSEISNPEFVSLLKQLAANSPLDINLISLPIIQENNSELLYNPPISNNNQWVYESNHNNWSEINSYIKKNIK